MLTAGKLREILRSPSIGDDMPVLIRTKMIDGTMQADDINDIGVIEAGRRNWQDLVLPGVPNVTLSRYLMVSTLEPIAGALPGAAAKPR